MINVPFNNLTIFKKAGYYIQPFLFQIMIKLPFQIKEVLKMLKGTSYVITGSTALFLQDTIHRVPGDLDLLTADEEVLNILKQNCTLDLSETLSNPTHHRFLLWDCWYVDVFWTKKTTAITKKVGSIDVNISPYWEVFNTKLKIFSEDPKTTQDIKDYFTLKEQSAIKHLEL